MFNSFAAPFQSNLFFDEKRRFTLLFIPPLLIGAKRLSMNDKSTFKCVATDSRKEAAGMKDIG